MELVLTAPPEAVYQQSQEEQFLSLLLPAKSSLSRFISALERNDDDARDVMSETIAIAWQEFSSLQSHEAFLSWIMTIARRLVYRKERRDRFRGYISSTKRFFSGEDDADNSRDAFAEIPDEISARSTPDAAADVQLLYDMLEKLPLKQREAVILSDVVGYSLQEIAEIQGDGLSAVKQRVVRGREKLRMMLQDSFS